MADGVPELLPFPADDPELSFKVPTRLVSEEARSRSGAERRTEGRAWRANRAYQ